MSFKKFLAPIVSCCCATSSLSSCCSATYRYSDLCAVEITNYNGLNGTSDIAKLATRREIVYVSKELENLLKQDDTQCARCQKKMRLSESFVVAHDGGALHRYDDKTENYLNMVLEDTNINENTKIVKDFLSHLVCKECADFAIKIRWVDKEKKQDENGLLRCPVLTCNGTNESGESLRSLEFLGDAVGVQRKKSLEELRNNLYDGCKTICCIVPTSMLCWYIGLYLADHIFVDTQMDQKKDDCF